MKSVAQLRRLLHGTLQSHGRRMKRLQGSQNYSGQSAQGSARGPSPVTRRNSTAAAWVAAAALPTWEGSSWPAPSIVAETYDFFIGEVVPNVPTPTAAQFADGLSILSRQNDKLKGFNVARFIDTSYLDNSLKRGLDRSQ